jgi:4-phospho-D-threonate 3-dehydrogenase / 4-phospho-D-erythronate 3-dehydrogenase
MKRRMPLLAITMGDPAGIGPEIALKALAYHGAPSSYTVFIIGDMNILQRTARALSLNVPLYGLSNVIDIAPSRISVLDMNTPSIGDAMVGKPQAICGLAAYSYIIKAIELAQSKSIDAIVTCPINKEALKMAGVPYPGHTEILADKTGTRDFSMMFSCDNVHVVHVTTHVSLKNALGMITSDRVLSHTRLLDAALKNLGIASPRIAVSGLNPHAGENGLFGDEEIVHIAPAVARARQERIDASGPYPPDTVFMRAFKGQFDGVVSMLHDHGFVALKSHDFEAGVNITIGLPIIRTSVGHGTAFDIAGKGKASEKSLLAAMDAARRMVEHRRE